MQKEETRFDFRKWITKALFGDIHLHHVPQQKILYVLRLVTLAGRSFVTDSCPQRASALAFTTTLSLVPVSALFVLYFKMAGKLEELSGTIQQWVLQTFVAEPAQNVSVYLDQFVENIHTKTLGTLGVAGLVVSAYLVFRTVELSINDIWKIRKHRSILIRFQILSSILIVVPSLMIASIYLSGRLQGLKFLGQSLSISTYSQALFVATPFILTLLTFFFIFKLLPNTKVRFYPALIAAIFASILFEFGKTGFNLYVVHVISVSKIYGALGLIPMLLLWIYLSWLIILMGVELSAGIQNFDLLYEEARERLRLDPLDIALHEEWGYRIVQALGARFNNGEGAISADQLARDTGIRESHVTNHLEVLVEANWIACVEKEGDTFYVFTKPQDQISKTEIFNTFRTKLKLDPI